MIGDPGTRRCIPRTVPTDSPRRLPGRRRGFRSEVVPQSRVGELRFLLSASALLDTPSALPPAPSRSPSRSRLPPSASRDLVLEALDVPYLLWIDGAGSARSRQLTGWRAVGAALGRVLRRVRSVVRDWRSVEWDSWRSWKERVPMGAVWFQDLPGAGSREPGAGSREPGAGSRPPAALCGDLGVVVVHEGRKCRHPGATTPRSTGGVGAGGDSASSRAGMGRSGGGYHEGGVGSRVGRPHPGRRPSRLAGAATPRTGSDPHNGDDGEESSK